MGSVLSEIMGSLFSLMVIVGAIMLLPIIPAAIYGEYYTISSFALPAIVTIGLGLYLNRKYPLLDMLSLEATIVIAPIAWLFVSVIGAIPLALITGITPLDALFETVSGFTTTGMTLFTDIESLPSSVLFWRSLTEWIGGVGVILLFTMLLRGTMSTWRLYSLEGREEKFTTSVKSTIRSIWFIYALLTAVCSICLYFAGMSAFDAINHAMTTMATGGFSTKTASIASFDQPVKLVLCIFMTLGALSFTLFYNIYRLDLRQLLRDAESKVLIAIIFSAGTVVSIIMAIGGSSIPDGVVDGFFNVISIATTTGFTSIDITKLPLFVLSILLVLMMIGGCAGSTASGLKIWRLIVLYRLVKREVAKISLPHQAVMPIKIEKKVLGEEYVMKVGAYFFLYIFSLIVVFTLLTFSVPDPLGAFSLAISAQSNVGPAYYPVSILDDYSKGILIFAMWLGRLEILPVLVLFSKGMPNVIRNALKGRGSPHPPSAP